MPIDIQWYCEGRVLYVRYAGDTTVEEVIEFSTSIRQLVESSDAPLVHMISDVSEVGKVLPLRDIIKHYKLPPRIGWGLVMGLKQNPVLSFIAHIVVSILRLRHRDVDTLDEALDFLQKMDSTLPDLQQFRGVVESGAAQR